jgi:hypothetical protein
VKVRDVFARRRRRRIERETAARAERLGELAPTVVLHGHILDRRRPAAPAPDPLSYAELEEKRAVLVEELRAGGWRG